MLRRAPVLPRRRLPFLALLVACAAGLAPAARAQANRPDPLIEVAEWQGLPVVAGELLVQFRAGTPPAAQALRHAQAGATALGSPAPGLVRVRTAPGSALEPVLARYAAFPEVAFAQPNVLHRRADTPSDPKWSLQWGLPKVKAAQAWDLAAGHPETVVAVLDSGVDLAHPDLAGKLAWGLDTFAGDAVPQDEDGHGTHCAGLAAAQTDNGVGVAGLGFACRFAAYRCGNETFPSSALVAAIHDARQQGARVLSMSWGSPYNDPAIRAALQQARDAGCVLVAAAGNDNSSSLFYPAAHAFVIGVGASTSSDARASFSNYGSWVSVAAPGQSIYSTWKGKSYAYSSGTSMACPLVAGLAGLLYAHLGGPRTPEAAAQVRLAIEGSALPIGSWVVHGRIDALAAVQSLGPPGPPQLEAPAVVAEGAAFAFAWSAPPAASAWLLLSLDSATFVWQGQPLLAIPLVMLPAATDSAGLGGLSLVAPAGSAGLSFHTQLAAIGIAPAGLSAVRTTTITP